MADANRSESPFETVAERVDERTVEAFELLGNETRLAILLALWEAVDPSRPPSASALSFSRLRRRLGLRHGTQFNYHLDRLVGRFVRRTDGGYALTTSAERVLSTVLAGTLRDPPSFSDVPLDTPCMLCGTSTVVDYSDSVLTQRCPGCQGVAREPGEPSGLIAREYRPPVGLRNRTPREFARRGKAWNRHQRHAFIEGVCPECSGTVTTSVRVCEDHDGHDRTICERCERVHEVDALFVCDVCKSGLATGLWNTVLTETAVVAFFHDHGLDAKALEDAFEYGVLYDAVDVTLRATDPLDVLVTVELDGDALTVVLDDDARVRDVTGPHDESAPSGADGAPAGSE